MQRRNLLIGMGSLAAGGAATIGTGAFTSAEATRGVNVRVANDNNAFLRITDIQTPNSQDYTSWTPDGQLKLFDPSNVLGSGFNNNALTFVDNLFQLQNQSSQKQYVWLDEINNPNYTVTDDFGNESGTHIVGFYAPGDRSGSWSGVSYGSAPEDPTNDDRGPNGADGSKAPADGNPFRYSGEINVPNDGDIEPPGVRAKPVELAVGEKIDIRMAVDTRFVQGSADFETGGEKIQPGRLLNEVIIKSEADKADAATNIG